MAEKDRLAQVGIGFRLQFQFHLAAGLQPLCDGGDTYAVTLVRFRAQEEEPLRHNRTPAVEHCHLVHPLGHCLPVQLYLYDWGCGKGVTSVDVPVVHDDIAKHAATDDVAALEGGKHLLAHSVNTECATISLRLRQGKVLHAPSFTLPQVPHLEGELPRVGHNLKESPAQRVRLDGGEHVAPFVHHEAPFRSSRSPLPHADARCHPPPASPRGISSPQ